MTKHPTYRMWEVDRDWLAEPVSSPRDLDCDLDCLIASSVWPASVDACAARTWFMMALCWSVFW